MKHFAHSLESHVAEVAAEVGASLSELAQLVVVVAVHHLEEEMSHFKMDKEMDLNVPQEWPKWSLNIAK